MAQDRKLNKIKQPKYIYFIVCISSVLFIFGIIGWLILGSSRIEKTLKEKFSINIYLKENVAQDAKDELFERLRHQNYVKNISFKTKSQAMAEWLKSGGEDFMTYTDENFLPESFVINIKAEFVNTVMVEKIKNLIVNYDIVSDVQYPNNIFSQFDIIKKIIFYLFIIAVFLIIISLVILGYLIRLIIFNNRFVLKTMTLVGASHRFISRPFEVRAILNGMISSAIAICGICLVAFYFHNTFPEIRILINTKILSIVFIIIIFLGVFISWLSTYISISKYLNAPIEKLY